MRRMIPCLAILLWAPASGYAFVPMVQGSEEGIWRDASVVYGRVVAVSEFKRGYALVRLDIQCTLTGGFDAAERPEVEAQMHYGPLLPIHQPPRVSSAVVVLIRRGEEGRYDIPPYSYLFMPDHSAVVEVAGYNDPKVQQIIGRLRELRQPKAKAPKERAQRLPAKAPERRETREKTGH